MNKHELLHRAMRGGLKLDDCRVYSSILRAAKSGVAKISLSEIANESCVHRYSVQRSIRSLCDKGLIVPIKNGSESTAYEIKKPTEVSAPVRTPKAELVSAREPPPKAAKNEIAAYKERARAKSSYGAPKSNSPAAGDRLMERYNAVVLAFRTGRP